jgi:hypothetical protein
MNRYPALEIRQLKGLLAIAAVGCAYEVEEDLVFGDRQ